MYAISIQIAFVCALYGASFAQNSQPDTESLPLLVDSAKISDTIAADTARFFASTPEIPADLLYQGYLAPTGYAARNAAGFSEALANNAFCQSIRYGRSTSMNTIQPYGLLLPVDVSSLNGLVPDRLAGTDKENNYWSDTIVPLIDGTLVSRGKVPTARIPVMAFLWENGPFSENYLDLRFSRMVTRSVSLGILTHYRYLKGTTFSHGNGNVADFYRTMADSEFVVDKGRYAGARDQSVSLRAASQHEQLLDWDAQAGYRESHDELRFPTFDSLGRHLFSWDVMNRYATSVSMRMNSRPSGNQPGVSGLVGYDREITRSGPLLGDRPRYRGVNERSTIQVTPYYAFAHDTILAKLSGNRRALSSFDGTEYVVSDVSGAIGYAKSLDRYVTGLALDFEAGGFSYLGSQMQTSTPIASAIVSLARENLTAQFFVARKPLSFSQPVDTTEINSDIMAKPVVQAGAQLHIQENLWSFNVGWHGVSDVSEDLYSLWWIKGILPYKPPHSVWVIAPCITLPAGFTLYERCLLSDTRPILKSRAVLSHKTLIRKGKGSLRNDLSFEYWSSRNLDLGTYGGEEKLWLRPAMDVSLSTNVYIRSFSLYLKVDNLLNRAQAWIPGYPDPGLTFRWGFSWAIRG